MPELEARDHIGLQQRPCPLDFAVVADRLETARTDIFDLQRRVTSSEVLLGVQGERLATFRDDIASIKQSLHDINANSAKNMWGFIMSTSVIVITFVLAHLYWAPAVAK